MSCSSAGGSGRGLSEELALSLSACQRVELEAHLREAGLEPVFEVCGGNGFREFAWSPRGTRLLYSLETSAWVLQADADDKPREPLQIEVPRGPPAWLGPHRVALPVGRPLEAKATLAIYDANKKTLETRPLEDLTNIREVLRWSADTIVVLAEDPSGRRQAWRMDLSTGLVALAFPWLAVDPESLTAQPDLDRVVVGHKGVVTVYGADRGEVIATFAGADRGALSADGRFVALESRGPLTSIFWQPSWRALSDEALSKELAKAAALEAELPPEVDGQVRPPVLSFAEVATGERHRWTAVHGQRFAWYEASPGWGGFVLWGFGGRQFQPNVVLKELAPSLERLARGEDVPGFEPWTDVAAP